MTICVCAWCYDWNRTGCINNDLDLPLLCNNVSFAEESSECEQTIHFEAIILGISVFVLIILGFFVMVLSQIRRMRRRNYDNGTQFRDISMEDGFETNFEGHEPRNVFEDETGEDNSSSDVLSTPGFLLGGEESAVTQETLDKLFK